MQKAKILIVEDDPVTRCLLVAFFDNEQYGVIESSDGAKMWLALKAHNVDLVLLDINLPDEDGFTLLRKLRAQSDVGLIIVSSRNEDLDRIIGLEMGADDYVTKPFNGKELLARVERVLERTARRNQQEENVIFKFKSWTLNCTNRRLTLRDNEPVYLTNGEFTLLLALLKNPRVALSREKLIKKVSNREWMPNNRTIDVIVNRLRQKIEIDP
jgi:DNA-binding response OmpR family regulator